MERRKVMTIAAVLISVMVAAGACGKMMGDAPAPAEKAGVSSGDRKAPADSCRLPRYLTKPRQRRSEWDMAGSDGISRVSAVFRGKSLLTNKMRII